MTVRSDTETRITEIEHLAETYAGERVIGPLGLPARMTSFDERKLAGALTDLLTALRAAWVREDTLEQALREDAAGRSFAELLVVAADLLDGYGGGPVADSLRLKADDVLAAALARKEPDGV